MTSFKDEREKAEARKLAPQWYFELYRLPGYDGSPTQLKASAVFVINPDDTYTNIIMRPESGSAADYFALRFHQFTPADDQPGWIDFTIDAIMNGMGLLNGTRTAPGRIFAEQPTPDMPTFMLRMPEHTETYKTYDGRPAAIEPGTWLLTGRRNK